MEFFTVNTKLPGMAIFASKDITAVKKVGLYLMITESSRDYEWLTSLMLTQLS